MPDSAYPLPCLGRSRELALLKTFYERGWHRGAGFMLLYGRKGIGKTRLLQQFLQDEAIAAYFYWQAPADDAATQLRAFSQALLRFDTAQSDSSSPDFTFSNWRDALDYLAQIAERSEAPLLFILEGFTDLCHQSRGLSSFFQHAWDHRLKEIANLRFIITGSHVGTMVREVLAYTAPLYLRANTNLHLKPLPYTALLDLFPDRSAEERMIIYAITGGMPAYLPVFVQQPDLPAAVERLCFAADSSFLADMESLFEERLAEPALCRTILAALSDGPATPAALSRRLGISYDDFQQHLYFLRLLKLVADDRSVHRPGAGLHIRHILADASLRFYYQHLKPALTRSSPKETAVAACSSLYASLGHDPPIALCQEWIWAAASAQQIDIQPQAVGAYWDDQAETPEYPVAAADPSKKKLLLGVGLRENGRFTSADLEERIQIVQQLAQGKLAGWHVALVVFGRRPFAPEVRAAAAMAGVRLVTLADIETLLLMAREAMGCEQDGPASEPFEI